MRMENKKITLVREVWRQDGQGRAGEGRVGQGRGGEGRAG